LGTWLIGNPAHRKHGSSETWLIGNRPLLTSRIGTLLFGNPLCRNLILFLQSRFE
jgi:hypothetical protein